MKTIIELYDERPIENVLGAEMFRPRELVILCPAELESTHTLSRSLKKYFEHRGCPIKVTVVPVRVPASAPALPEVDVMLKSISSRLDTLLSAFNAPNSPASPSLFTVIPETLWFCPS